jgi:HAMP domain-containing protein
MAAIEHIPLPARPDARPSMPRRLPAASGPGSLRFAVVVLLVAVLLIGMTIALTTRHVLTARVHDYAILNLAGQLRELANGMALDSRSLLVDGREPPDDAELARWRERVVRQASLFDRIVESFFQRELSPDLTGLDAPVSCNWDAPSLAQLAATRGAWLEVRRNLAVALAPGAGRDDLLQAARRLQADGPPLLEATRALAGSFKVMMQAKLQRALDLQFASVGAMLVIGVLCGLWVRARVLRPLAAVELGAQRVLDGRLGEQVPVQGGTETRAVAEALNRLSTRMQVLFDLAGRAGAGLSTVEMLRAMLDELGRAAGIDAVIVVRRHRALGETAWTVRRGVADAALAAAALADGRTLSTAGRPRARWPTSTCMPAGTGSPPGWAWCCRTISTRPGSSASPPCARGPAKAVPRHFCTPPPRCFEASSNAP